MAWLPHGENISKISLFVLAQLTNVTDGQTDGHHMPAIAALCIASHGKNVNRRTCGRLRFNLTLHILTINVKITVV